MAKLNKAKGNMYEWVTHTLSVGKGCSHQCTYCYVKARGRIQPDHYVRDTELPDLGSGKTIFVGHQSDLFSDEIPVTDIIEVLTHLSKFPDNKYVLQTKNPLRLADMLEFHLPDYFPPTLMIGTTIETNRQDVLDRVSKAPSAESRSLGMSKILRESRTVGIAHVQGAEKFLTVEPIMRFDCDELVRLIKQANPDFVNIGADSKGHGLEEPTRDEVMGLAEALGKVGIRINKKFNLERLVGI